MKMRKYKNNITKIIRMELNAADETKKRETNDYDNEETVE